MIGDPLPDQDHICRYCSVTKITENGSITGAAFQLRSPDKYLSVNWLEFFQLADRQGQIKEVRKAIRLKPGASAKLAVLNVEEMVNFVRTQSPDARKLRVLHEPEENDPSHSGIYGFGHDDNLIADLIAETVQELYPAVEPK
ncbi:MAG: hypothetical protein Q8P24_13485 [Desulfobacterales bacterium]|nr:hypothetical protein [Desulfobacterales bacterium]